MTKNFHGGAGGKGFKEASFADRLEAQKAAKQALLEKAKAIARKSKETAPDRDAERKRIAEAREVRAAERAEQKRQEDERLAAERAAAEAAREEAEKAAEEEAERLANEQKARRDERYAKRKGAKSKTPREPKGRRR
jgi:hypothetical protein